MWICVVCRLPSEVKTVIKGFWLDFKWLSGFSFQIWLENRQNQERFDKTGRKLIEIEGTFDPLPSFHRSFQNLDNSKSNFDTKSSSIPKLLRFQPHFPKIYFKSIPFQHSRKKISWITHMNFSFPNVNLQNPKKI